MTVDPETPPAVGTVFRHGADDLVLDSILLVGAVVVVLLMILLGRTPVTTLAVALSVLSFVGYVIVNALQ